MRYFLILLSLVTITKATPCQSVAFADSVFLSGDYENAIVQYESCLKNNQRFDKKILANIYLRKGVCHNQLNKNKAALADYFEALQYFEKEKDKLAQAKTCLNLASLYFTLKEYNNTEKYITRSEALFSVLNDTAQLIKVYGTKALLYDETIGSKKAIETRLFALQHFKKHFNDELESNYYFNLGDDYVQLNTDSSILYYQKTIDLAKKSGDSSLLPSTWINLGSVYLKRNDVQNAGRYLLLAKNILDVESDSLAAREMYYYLSVYYYKNGAYKQAYAYADTASIFADQLFNKDKTQVTAELSEKYESDKKDAEIISQQKQNKLKSRNLLLSLLALGLVGVLGGVSFINYRKKQKANKQLYQQNEYILSLNKKLDASNQVKTKLFSIISHDLRSPVSSLFAYLQLQQHTGKTPTAETTAAVTRQTENLLETLEDLLMWSKSQLEQFTPEYSNLNLQQSVTEAQQLCAADSNIKKLTFTNNIAQSISIRTDANMFTIIIRNIMANAVQNAMPGTEIAASYERTNTLHLITLKNTTVVPEKELMLTLNSDLVNSKKHGLGKILIQEFTEKLNGQLEYTYTSGKLHTLIKLPV